MKNKIPKELLSTKYRKEMWKRSEIILKKLEKVLSISEVHMIGSFTTAKIKPQDIDVVIFLKTKARNAKEVYSLDFQLVPDNAYGNWMLKESEKWVKRKYGAKKSAVIKLK